MYPVMLSLRDRTCLVVGGGGVALRKVEGLLAEGARVTVIAPDAIEPLRELATSGAIALRERSYEAGDTDGQSLVFAATDDRAVNRRVFEDADSAGIWANVADDPELCSFHLPSRLRRGALQIAVASAGEAPFVVRRMRQVLERRFGQEWAAWVDAAARFRQAVRKRGLSGPLQESAFDTFFAATIDEQRLTARVPTLKEQEAWISPATTQQCTATSPAETHVPHSGFRVESRQPAPKAGLVSLVGAGPGDPGLMTLRGRQRLLAADAVVCDRLAMNALPCDLPPHVELHWVGKIAGRHPVPQEEINALLVRLAREGKRVVRLKGGDPYVFGRGGEEAEVLHAEGIPFEVVPSVTAAVAVPAYAGIPVTHRDEVVRMTLVTAHESAKDDGPQVRWDLLAADVHATILGYMGVTSLPHVVEKLLASGMNPTMPAAIIERGSTSGQRVVRATVADLPDAAKRAGIRPPALFVIGPTVRHADRLDWFGNRPLLGERFVIPAPAGELTEPLELAGVEVVELPLPVTPAARIVMSALPLTGCVLRDADEVDALDDERDGSGWSTDTVAWCIGATAARRAREAGWSDVEELPGSPDAADLVAALLARARSSPRNTRPGSRNSR
jgi:uroporphyrin-III C-methyltransferase / precorrin-2 dehydrogenase / sirohydrochlorin ferrochelatase